MHGRELLLEWIKRRGIRHVEAAKIMGIPKQTLSHFISGRRSPKLSIAVRIERATGIPVEAWLPTSDGDIKRRGTTTAVTA